MCMNSYLIFNLFDLSINNIILESIFLKYLINYHLAITYKFSNIKLQETILTYVLLPTKYNNNILDFIYLIYYTLMPVCIVN